MSKKSIQAITRLIQSYSGDNEISTKIALSTLISALDYRVPKAQARAAQALTELREMTDNFNGSEVQTRNIDRKETYARGVFETFEALQAMHIDLKSAYEEASGDKWTAYVAPKPQLDKDGNPIKAVVEIPDSVSDTMDAMAKSLTA